MAAAGQVCRPPGPSRWPGPRPPTAGQDRTVLDHARTSQPPYPELPAVPGQVRAAMLGAPRRARPGPGPPPPAVLGQVRAAMPGQDQDRRRLPPFPELAGGHPDLDRRARSSLELAPDLTVPAPAPTSTAPAHPPCSSSLELVPDLAASELAGPRAGRIGAVPRDGEGLGRPTDCAGAGWMSSGENSGGGHGGELRPARGRRRHAKHFLFFIF
jgi:hypothetical protein